MSYAKGVYYERNLLQYLGTQGFSTLRVAGSGHNSPVDIVAMRDGVVIAIECKAHTNKPRLQEAKVQELREWCDVAGALGFLAWRAPKQDWLFLPLDKMVEKSYDDHHWLSKDTLLRTLR